MFNYRKKIKQLNASFGQIKAQEYFNFEFISSYFKNSKEENVFHTIPTNTCNDLDFHELFQFVDRTHSKIGQQFLYCSLRRFPTGESFTAKNEQVIELLQTDSELRLKVQFLLEKLNYEGAYHICSLFQDKHIERPKWFFIIQLLSILSFILIFLTPFSVQFFLFFLGVFITNSIIHYWNKKNVHQYLSSIPQLFKLIQTADDLYSIDTFKSLGYNVKNEIAQLNPIKRKSIIFRIENASQGDLQAFWWAGIELFKITFLSEPRNLFRILTIIDSKRFEIERLYSFIGSIDMLLSVASLRSGLDSYCLPKINSDCSFNFSKVYHPLIVDCIPNNVNLTNKSVLLTGSNMSGKTSFIRTVGLNVITGITLNTCFAAEVTMPKTRLFSAIRITDDLMNDKSYYFEEVVTLSEMIHESQKDFKNLFLLDEIFKGTNTVERIAGGKAVLSFLAKNGNTVFVSTHDIELTDMLSNDFDLYHFSESLADNNIIFDYELKNGKLEKRNAIRILEMSEYPKEIIEEANLIAKQLDENYQSY